MPTISLRSFLKTGDFGNIRGGCTREELEQELGPPETHDTGSRKHPYPTIWKYGDIEFFFEQYRRDGCLQMVYLDDFEIPKGWGQLVVEPWNLHGGLTCEAAESALEQEGVEYHTSSIDPDCVNLVTSTGVNLQFIVKSPDELSPKVGLGSVSRKFELPLTQIE